MLVAKRDSSVWVACFVSSVLWSGISSASSKVGGMREVLEPSNSKADWEPLASKFKKPFCSKMKPVPSARQCGVRKSSSANHKNCQSLSCWILVPCPLIICCVCLSSSDQAALSRASVDLFS